MDPIAGAMLIGTNDQVFTSKLSSLLVVRLQRARDVIPTTHLPTAELKAKRKFSLAKYARMLHYHSATAFCIHLQDFFIFNRRSILGLMKKLLLFGTLKSESLNASSASKDSLIHPASYHPTSLSNISVKSFSTLLLLLSLSAKITPSGLTILSLSRTDCRFQDFCR